MGDITKLQEENIGGARYLLYADAADVQQMVIDSKTNTLRSIGLKSGKTWSRMECTVNTMLLKEDTKIKNGNDYFSSTVSGIVPKDTPEKQALFIKLSKKRLVVLVGTRNNELKALGTKDEPCKFFVDKKSTGTKSTDADKLRINFTVTRRHPAMIFRADLILYINDQGKLVYDNQFTPATTVSIDANGKLVVSGPDEDQYFLSQYTLWRN